jgi:hypothetical protein
LPNAAVLAKHNTGPVDDPPLHPLPFHPVFDAHLYGEIRRAHGQLLRPKRQARTALQIYLDQARLEQLHRRTAQ